jgi:hypothetical protein
MNPIRPIANGGIAKASKLANDEITTSNTVPRNCPMITFLASKGHVFTRYQSKLGFSIQMILSFLISLTTLHNYKTSLFYLLMSMPLLSSISS